MTRDHHTDSRCERLRAVLCDRRVHVLVMTLVVVALLGMGLAVAQEDNETAVYSGGDDETIQEIDDSGNQIWRVNTHGEPHEGLSLSPDGTSIYSILQDNVSRIDIETQTSTWTQTPPDDLPPDDVVVSPSGEIVYVLYGSLDDGIIIAHDADTGSIVWESSPSHLEDSPSAIDISPDGSSVFFSNTGGDNDIGVLDADTGDFVRSFGEQQANINAIDSSPDGEHLYVASEEIVKWEIEIGEAVDRFNVDPDFQEFEDVVVSPDGETVYTASVADDEVISFDSETFVERWRYSGPSPPSSVSISRDGETVYSGWRIDEPDVIAINDDDGSEIWVNDDHSDSVEDIIAAGETTGPASPSDPQLDIDAPIWMEPGTSQSYEVTHYPEYSNDSRGPAEDVTGNASLTSDNTTVLAVDSTAHSLTASEDDYARVTLNASHDGLETTHNVTVSPMTAEYLEIIPGPYRFTATFNETGFQMILIAIMSGVVATRLSTAFGGIGAAQLVLLIGWFAGFVSLGIALVGLFTAMFIGFNLAANVDYSVRR